MAGKVDACVGVSSVASDGKTSRALMGAEIREISWPRVDLVKGIQTHRENSFFAGA